jgi:hypothetical protein
MASHQDQVRPRDNTEVLQSARPPHQKGPSQAPTGGPPAPTIASCIFTPLTEDLGEPFLPPQDRVERLRQTIRKIDENSKKVTANLLEHFAQEKERLVQEAGATEPDAANAVMSPEETDDLIQAMSSKAELGVDYNVLNIPPLDLRTSHDHDTQRPGYSRAIMSNIEAAIENTKGYAGHVEGVKAFYRDALEKELQRTAGFRS